MNEDRYQTTFANSHWYSYSRVQFNAFNVCFHPSKMRCHDDLFKLYSLVTQINNRYIVHNMLRSLTKIDEPNTLTELEQLYHTSAHLHE